MTAVRMASLLLMSLAQLESNKIKGAAAASKVRFTSQS